MSLSGEEERFSSVLLVSRAYELNQQQMHKRKDLFCVHAGDSSGPKEVVTLESLNTLFNKGPYIVDK